MDKGNGIHFSARAEVGNLARRQLMDVMKGLGISILVCMCSSLSPLYDSASCSVCTLTSISQQAHYHRGIQPDDVDELLPCRASLGEDSFTILASSIFRSSSLTGVDNGLGDALLDLE